MPNEPDLPIINQQREGDADNSQVQLVYKIEGTPSEIPIFELAHTPQALGTVIQETTKVIGTTQSEVAISVRPFAPGSFGWDVVMLMHRHPELLYFIGPAEAQQQIKTALEYIGLIKKAGELFDTVKDVIEFLQGDKPVRTEKQPDGTVNYTAKNGQQTNFSGRVDNLYTNPVIINNYYYAFGGNGLDRQGVDGVRTFLKGEEQQTSAYITKNEVLTLLKSYSEPLPSPPRIQKTENTTTEFLNPKEGTYGSAEGVTFLPAGRKRGGFKATITDPAFLARFHSGKVRFFQNDLLEVQLLTESTLKDNKLTKKFTIQKVVNYEQAPVQGTSD